MQSRGNYSNKQQQKVNEFNGLTLVEISHFEIKIVFYWYILVDRRRRFYGVSGK
jgi:hypothetical protein